MERYYFVDFRISPVSSLNRGENFFATILRYPCGDGDKMLYYKKL